jgi:hypothetical protein
MTNASSVLLLAQKLGIDISTFDGMTTAEAIEFIANNYETATTALPAVTASDNGKILKVVDGKWAVASA